MIVAVVAIAFAWAVREFFVLAGPAFMAGMYLGVHGAYLVFRKPIPVPAPGEVPPLSAQVTPAKARAHQVAMVAMISTIAVAPLAYFFRGPFLLLAEIGAMVFCVSFILSSWAIRCPNCGSPLPYLFAKHAVSTDVPSWRPKCPRCRSVV
jgi:hypothetical protein